MIIATGLLLAVAWCFLSALGRAVVLFWPVMIGLGQLHYLIPMVPALGWLACFWLVFVISLLIPVGSSSVKAN